jgi:PAS domain S-box-containing protein
MTILIADDFEPNRKVLNAVFSHEGFRVIEAADGEEALILLAREEDIAAVISDVLMPNMDGYRLCAEVRRGERLRDLPFIFYTSTYTSPADKDFALGLGADRFFRRPAPALELVQAVREMTGAPWAIHRRDVSLPSELDLSRQYSAQLIAKLEEKNVELHQRTRDLRESSDRLQALIRAAPVAIVSFDRSGNITEWNSAAERIFGWNEAEVAGPGPPQRCVASQAEFDDLHERIIGQETINGLERLHRRRDGTVVIVDVNMAPLRAADGQISGTLAVFTDVTERKRAQDARRLSEQRFVAFMDNQPAFAWMKDLEGRYVYINRSLQELPEHRNGCLGKTDAETWPAEIAHLLRVNDQKVIAERKSLQTIESYLVDGQRHALLVTKFPIFDETGAVVMVGGSSVDIAARLEMERALRESEERFRQLAENIDDVFWITNAESTEIIYISPAYHRVWGRTRESLYRSPQSWMEAIHSDDKEQVIATLRHRGSGPLDLTYRIVRPDGSIRWIRDRRFPVRNDHGAVVRFAGIAEDITETKQTEKQFEYFAELLQGLSHRLFEIQEEERRHLARELHDEIGQQLTAAKLNLKLIASEVPPANADRLEDSIRILDHLLQQVRQLSLDLRPPLLDELGLVPALRWLADQQGQRSGLRITFSANVEQLDIDVAIRIACFRVAQEAITNAIRHANARVINLELRHEAERIWLSVRDDGVGFDPAAIQQQAARGASFGLVSMKERVLLAGGEFAVESSSGGGTEIRAWFPFVPPGPSTAKEFT